MRGLLKIYKITVVLAGMLIVVAFTACSAHMAMRKQFDESTNHYNKLLSSQSFDAAGMYVADKLSEEFSARVKAAKNIKVVNHRIVRAKYDEEKGTADIEVEFEYYSLSSFTLKTLLDVQKWEYVSENDRKQWRLMSLLPEFP